VDIGMEFPGFSSPTHSFGTLVRNANGRPRFAAGLRLGRWRAHPMLPVAANTSSVD
jgi:hypothetical protein